MKTTFSPFCIVVKRGLLRTLREEREYKCMQTEWSRTRLGPRNMKWVVSGIITLNFMMYAGQLVLLGQ